MRSTRRGMAFANGDLHLNMCQKIFIQRDYTCGLKVQFETTYPDQLRGKISEDVWTFTIDTINARFREAEEVCAASVLETFLGCFTCYLNRAFTRTRYEKKLLEIARFLDRENSETYLPSGLHILNPMDRGLRVIEISILPSGKP